MATSHSSCVLHLILGALLAGGACAQSAPLWGDLEKGSFDTGFRRIWTVDATRPWSRSPNLDSLGGEIGRPIRIDIWYPADCDREERLVLRDYLKMEPPAEGFSDLVFLTHRWDEYSFRGLAEDSTAFERLMAVPTAACGNAPAASGRFPVVVYSAGWFNRTPDNSILAEYLASHGFIVAGIPQLNPGLWTFNFRSDAQSVEHQARDLEVAISEVIQLSYADRRRVAAMGYSTGGDVALLVAGRSPLIDAVVGLDASWTLGRNNDVESSPSFSPSDYSTPTLVTRRPSNVETVYNAVVDSLLSARVLLVEVPGADHGSFSDDPGQRVYLGTDTPAHRSTHASISRTVLYFLNHVLSESRLIETGTLMSDLQALGVEVSFHPPTRTREEEDLN